jgi:soluble P-type ATPase
MKYKLQKEEIELKTIVLDLNGTLSNHGVLYPGVKERLDTLRELGFHIVLFTGDQRGTAKETCAYLGIDFTKVTDAKGKGEAMEKLDCETCVAIGNARIDIETFKKAKLAIGTLQAEGIHPVILPRIDILVPNINDALDLLLNPDSLCATLKK